MIDPKDSLEVQVEKQGKIIQALIARMNNRHELGGSAYSLFQSAIALQSKVSEKTRDLEAALFTLGDASSRLETSEEARAQTQRSLSDALETMDGGFALFTDGKLQVYNEFFKNLIQGVSGMIAPGLDISEYNDAITAVLGGDLRNPSEHARIDRPAMGRSAHDAAPFVFELKNDRWFVITSRQASLGNMVILQTEITTIVRKNRLEKTQLINEQETFLRATFDYMPQGVGTFSAEGTLMIANARFGVLLGLPIALNTVGTSFGQIIEYLHVHVLHDPLPHANFDSLLRYLRRHQQVTLRTRLQDNTVVDISMHALPDGGCIVNVLDVTVESQTTEMLEASVEERTAELMDVNARLMDQHTHQARVEEDLRIAKTEVEEAMNSKTKFFAAASHDLLQPVNAAKLFISMLVEQSGGTESEEIVNRLDGSFQSIEGLLHALLDIARLEAVDTHLVPAAVSLDSILQPIGDDMLVLAMEKGIDLRVVPSSLWVQSDQRYLSRSVQNLVHNAIQYTTTGRVLLGCRRRGSSVLLEVWDTGIGISKSDQERVFKEFTRVKASGRQGAGMGLGLSIVERACRHLKHRIDLRSKPGVGSVFSIELPIVESPIQAARRLVHDEYKPEAEMDLIVILIENDPGVSFAMVQKLESWGASVLAVESTQEALDMVDEIVISPDIILADYQLNGDDNGVKAILSLREKLKSPVPAIMITANHDKEIKEAGLENNFSVLTKPVQLSRLRSLMDWKTLSQGGYVRFD